MEGNMKKAIIVLLSIMLILSLSVGFVACNNASSGTNGPTPEEPAAPRTYFDWSKTVMIWLGDSIAEALAGPSPITERENYGYYGLLGQGNDYTYVNKAVSGWKSKQLLNYLTTDPTTPEHEFFMELVTRANIIEISILGNDLLQDDLGKLLTNLAKYKEEVELNADYPDFVSDKLDYVNDILFNDTFKSAEIATANGANVGDSNPYNSTANFANIIARIKEVNPNAKILVQTIYNPVTSGSTLISTYMRQQLKSTSGYKFSYGQDDYRALGDELIEMMNNIVRDYATEHPGDITVVEVHDKFEEYYQADTSEYKADSRRLFSQDYIHPSNEGHALIASITQDVLVDMGLATMDGYVQTLKEIRVKQLDKFYSYDGCEVNLDTAKSAINAATTSYAVNKAYFDSVTRSEYASLVAAFEQTDRMTPESFYPWVSPNYLGDK